MYVNSPVLLCSSYSTPPLAPLTDRNKPAVWAATPREAGWITWLYYVFEPDVVVWLFLSDRDVSKFFFRCHCKTWKPTCIFYVVCAQLNEILWNFFVPTNKIVCICFYSLMFCYCFLLDAQSCSFCCDWMVRDGFSALGTLSWWVDKLGSFFQAHVMVFISGFE